MPRTDSRTVLSLFLLPYYLLTKRSTIVLLSVLLLFLIIAVVSRTLNFTIPPLTEKNFIWSSPRSDGFNNQLISVYESLACAIHLNRTLVLPHFFENVRRDTFISGPYPFEDYFDIGPLTTKGFHPDVTTASILRQSVGKNRQFEANHMCNQGVIYYQGRISRHGNKILSHYQRRLFTSLKLQRISSSKFKSFVETDLEKYQCMDDSLCSSSRKALNRLGVYSNYSLNGQGFDIRNSPFFYSLRRRFHPSRSIRKLALYWIRQMKTSKFMFNAMHVRRADYDNKCETMPDVCDEFGPESMYQSEERLKQALKQFTNNKLPVFVSTTSPKECKDMFSELDERIKIWYMQDFNIPNEFKWMRSRTDLLSLASQIVASFSYEFIGNRFSSYSSEINNMRYIRNANSSLMFF